MLHNPIYYFIINDSTAVNQSINQSKQMTQHHKSQANRRCTEATMRFAPATAMC